MSWDYFNKFEEIDDKYLPNSGEGETMATQITTAITKLVYKWFNDGDVYDNTHYLEGWANDLSSYANWLAEYVPGAIDILDCIKDVYDESHYEMILMKLCDSFQTFEFLKKYECVEKVGSIYDCDGPFEFREEEW